MTLSNSCAPVAPLANSRVLVVEDDASLREALVDTLELAGAIVLEADSGEEALALLPREYVDMVVSDVNMGGMDGHELLKALRRQYPQLPVLLVTAYGSIARSVEAMRAGAVDYLVKPFKPQLLVETVGRYVGKHCGDDEQPVAVEPSSQQLLQLARRVAATDSTVLICGESGTGKEVLARYIHRQSPRAKGPFIAINCAAIPENMLEAMLFGHEKGAFTGAQSAMPGKFEQANGGTLLLDEISEMSLPLQAKLLRVIQEREVERLGSNKVVPVNLRVVAASKVDLKEYSEQGKFRMDLYYRLNVASIRIPALRERREDVPELFSHFVRDVALRWAQEPAEFTSSLLRRLLAHDWPGNVRELRNAAEQFQLGIPLTIDAEQPDDGNASLDNIIASVEKSAIETALRRHHGNANAACEELGINYSTLYRRMKQYAMDLPAFRH